MSLFKRLDNLEQRLKVFENSIPEWIPISSYLSSQYGYSINGFRNYCLCNIEPQYFKKFGSQYHIHKNSLHLLNKK